MQKQKGFSQKEKLSKQRHPTMSIKTPDIQLRMEHSEPFLY
jgi:hypothetical protein